ncbi:MAG TPA: glycosyltransferase family 39 protein [bacterium]|nr:glycosyltransferase family 39 protein [bacterium]
MARSKPYVPREFSSRQWVWFLLGLGLVLRIPLLKLATAETTDGVLCLSYFSSGFAPGERFVLFPGYPFLLALGQRIGIEGWLWGRILSSLSSLLLLVPLWNFARRWMSLEMTGVVCAMTLLSPLLWFWSVKVMPDVLFLFLFWMGIERLAAAYADRSATAWWWGTAAAALSACTRPEGFLLIPWVVLTAERVGKEGGPWRRLAEMLLWAGPLWLLKPKFFTILDAYREGLGVGQSGPSGQIRFLNVVEHFYAYLSQPVYVFTPLVYWFAILGLGNMSRRNDAQGEAFRKVILQVFALLFLTRLFPSAYQDRYLMPFLPLVLVAAGVHLENFFDHWKAPGKPIQNLFWKNGILAFCLGWTALYSSAALISQSDSFGDVKRASEFLRTLPKDAVIQSDEVPKTSFWSGRQVVRMSYLTENSPFQPSIGDYVVLHSVYTPRLGFVDQNMRDRFGAVLIHRDDSMVVPLLTDLMEDQKLQNRVGATAFRFEPQFFTTLVYRVDGKKRGPKK